MVQELLSYNLLLDYFWHGAAGECAPLRVVSQGAEGVPNSALLCLAH